MTRPSKTRLSKTNFYQHYLSKGSFPNRIEKLIEVSRRITQKQTIHRLIDIGCENGELTIALKEATKASEVYGVDISKKAVEESKKRGVNAITLDIDESHLPFPAHYFDFVFVGELIEHLFNPDNVFEEIHRVVKTTGFVVITSPNLSSWLNRIVLTFGYQPYYTEVSTRPDRNVGKFLSARRVGNEPSGHIRPFTYRALRELLLCYEFKIIRVYGVMDQNLPRVLSLVDRIIGRIPSLSVHMIFVCSQDGMSNKNSEKLSFPHFSPSKNTYLRTIKEIKRDPQSLPLLVLSAVRRLQVRKSYQHGELFYKYKGGIYPDYLNYGNASSFILGIAQRYCKGMGIDIGADQWPFPGAISIQNESHQNAYKLDRFRDNSLDYVFSSHCLEHLKDWDRALALWIRKLKPGGILFLYLPHESMKLWNLGGPWAPLHKWEPKHEIIVPFLEEEGMQVIELNTFRDDYWSFHIVVEKNLTGGR